MAHSRDYEAPRLEEIGSLAELTQATQKGTQADGIIYVIEPGGTLGPGVPVGPNTPPGIVGVLGTISK